MDKKYEHIDKQKEDILVMEKKKIRQFQGKTNKLTDKIENQLTSIIPKRSRRRLNSI